MLTFLKSVVLFLSIVNFVRSAPKIVFNEKECESVHEFNEQLKQQIKTISTDAQKIIDFVVRGDDRGVTYRELAEFVDKFGPRLTGSQNLEDSIDYMVELLNKEGQTNVHTEEAIVPTWVRISNNNLIKTFIQTRGKEWAEMISPRRKPISILGLGGSVGTNGKELTGEVVVVKDFDELERRSNEVKGKFVVYNYDFPKVENCNTCAYLQQVVYRWYGATAAAKYGAIAALIRTVTSFSIDSPHTGMMEYNDSSVRKIPAVSITVEDAELFHRIVSRNETIKVNLYMEAQTGNDTKSRNTISELIGSEYPEQIVLVSGHLDSWDVGQGAMDDGGGAFISWRALSVIKKLGLRPKRTMRSVLWTGEEFGYIGAKEYVKSHSSEFNNMSIAMESDTGTFTPLGLSFSGTNPTAKCIVNEILKSLKPIKASQLTLSDENSDIELLQEKGVPGVGLENVNDRYFHFHHSNGDSITVLDSDQLDLCTAVWAVASYAFASLDKMLPR